MRSTTPRPLLGENGFGVTSILFNGVDGTTRKWGPIETYGGKLAENLVQATTRDFLTNAMRQVNTAGHRIVMHIRDEIVADEPADGASVIASLRSPGVTVRLPLPCTAQGRGAHWPQITTVCGGFFRRIGNLLYY